MSSYLSIPTLPPDHLRLPPQLEGLGRLVYNLYCSLHPEVRELFARIDRQIWSGFRSPVAVLRASRDWTSLLDDPDFMVRYHTVLEQFDTYMANGREHWFARHHGGELEGPVAYFCAEYGLHETLPIYSGGLGVLAGDHSFHLDVLGHLLADIRDRPMHLTPGRKLAPVDVAWVAALFEGVVPPWRRETEDAEDPGRWFINYM